MSRYSITAGNSTAESASFWGARPAPPCRARKG